MTRSNYLRGRDREYSAKRRLLREGALSVTRAASSKGAFDLIALYPTHAAFIQVKGGRRTTNLTSKRERAILVDLAAQLRSPDLNVAIWEYRNGQLHVERFPSGISP